LYFKLCNKVLRKAVARKDWAAQVHQHEYFSFDDFVTDSTEAFFLLVVENSYERWKWLYNHRHEINTIKSNYGARERTGHMKKLYKGKDDPCPEALYTSGHDTKRNSGWSDNGIKRYNVLFDAVINDFSENNDAFDMHIVNHFVSTKQMTESIKNHDNELDTKLAAGMKMRFRGRGTSRRHRITTAPTAAVAAATAAATTDTTTATLLNMGAYMEMTGLAGGESSTILAAAAPVTQQTSEV